ncbi:hypothetical protein FOVSG1_004901 [Fusarium oxysporum f. sp. vasinfectum]
MAVPAFATSTLRSQPGVMNRTQVAHQSPCACLVLGQLIHVDIVSDPDDDIPLKILKYTGESRPTLVQQDRRHSSTAMPAPSKVFLKLLSQPRPSQRSTSSGLNCAGCGSSSHRLNIYMKSSEHGLMTGCPCCNTLEHILANCPETKHDLAMQLEVIRMRANMPPF